MPGQPERDTNNWIWFDVIELVVQETGLPATTVIEEDKDWEVQVRFEFGGMLAPWIVSLPVEWEFSVMAESMGEGPEVTLGTRPGNTNAGQLVYGPGNPPPVPTISVPASTLSPGAYKLVGTVTIRGNPPPPIAGYAEGPIVQIIATT